MPTDAHGSNAVAELRPVSGNVAMFHQSLRLVLEVLREEFAWPFEDSLSAHFVMQTASEAMHTPGMAMMQVLERNHMAKRLGFASGRFRVWKLLENRHPVSENPGNVVFPGIDKDQARYIIALVLAKRIGSAAGSGRVASIELDDERLGRIVSEMHSGKMQPEKAKSASELAYAAKQAALQRPASPEKPVAVPPRIADVILDEDEPAPPPVVRAPKAAAKPRTQPKKKREPKPRAKDRRARTVADDIRRTVYEELIPVAVKELAVLFFTRLLERFDRRPPKNARDQDRIVQSTLRELHEIHIPRHVRKILAFIAQRIMHECVSR